jgi:hypothetical protein
MSERRDPHAADALVGPQGQPDDHGDVAVHGDPASAHADPVAGHVDDVAVHDAHASGHDDLVHGGVEVGPIDVRAWGAALIGIILGLVVALAFVLSLG